MAKPKAKRYFEKSEEQQTQKRADKGIHKKKSKSKDSGDFVTFKLKNDSLKYLPKNKKFEKLADNKPKPKSKYAGRVPVDKKLLEKHSRGEGINFKNVRFKINKIKIKEKEKLIEFSHEQAARTEILLTEEAGSLEHDVGETTTQFTQQQISEHVDITSATKHFELILRDFGPYRTKYTRNGRHLLLGGKMGHVAAFDWVTKKLHCELNVMESVHDVCWLHIETMFAVAQKNWVYIYDNQGIELHCLKKLNKVSRMEFLPYHFLLATASDEGYLSWLDVSIGQMVSQYNARQGKLSILAQNPQNGVLCTGHSKGIVCLWSPNVREPLAKMLCHKTALSGVHVDPKGMYLATSDVNRGIKIWDIRNLEGPLQSYRLRSSASDIAFSENCMLAVGMGNIVEVFRNCVKTPAKRTYMRHTMNSGVGNLMFCPYEDVLGVATATGFTSLLVPGSGEANFDTLEANPYQTKSQRREVEVKSLLEKISPEFITLDPTVLAEVDVPTLQEKIEANKKLLHLKPSKVDLKPRKNKRLGTAKTTKNKKIVREQAKREFVKSIKDIQLSEQVNVEKTKKIPDKPKSVLDRFLPKK